MAMGFTEDPERGCPTPVDDAGGVFNDRPDDTRTQILVAALRQPAFSHAPVDSDTWPRPTTENIGSTNGSEDKTLEEIRCLYGESLPTIRLSFGDGEDIGHRERR